MRLSGRMPNQLRPISIEPNITTHAEGSCLVRYGNTHVICTASLDEQVPAFLRGKNRGWITAEYGMLPRSTHSRIKREAAQGKQSGRTQEIQRLIGRSLRAVTDLEALGERQIIVDCDVIQADGGTRTASITGGYVALYMALQHISKQRLIERNPLTQTIAAVSCGIVNGHVLLDLDYEEDSAAEADANFVMTEQGMVVEIQATAEAYPFSTEQTIAMLEMAQRAIAEIAGIQRQLLRIPGPYFADTQ